jgi:hypothetical protein
MVTAPAKGSGAGEEKSPCVGMQQPGRSELTVNRPPDGKTGMESLTCESQRNVTGRRRAVKVTVQPAAQRYEFRHC